MSDQNIVYQGPEYFKLDCSKFSFNPSKESIAASFERFGGIPNGICKMMAKESNAIDGLLLDSSSKITCDNNGYVKSETIGIFTKVDTFAAAGGRAPYNQEVKWPYTHFYSKNDDYLKPQSSLPCIVAPDYSTTQNQECAQRQIVSCYEHRDSVCAMVSEAIKARVGLNLAEALCDKTPIKDKSPATQKSK